MGNATSSGGLPFDVGAEDAVWTAQSSQRHWRLHQGVKRATGEPVTIFRLDKKRNSAADVEAGKRGFLRLRTLRHPHVLACIDGAELDGEVVLATEPVVSLRSWMSVRVVGSESHADAVAWGMYCLCNALRFIHMDCKLAHCNINLDTVFVTPGGDWRLGGMDLLGPMDASNTILYGGGNLTPPEFQCPERRQGSIQSLLSGGLPIYTQDTWALGSLLKSCYGGQPPPDVLRYVDKLQSAEPRRRPSAPQFLRSAFVNRPAVKRLAYLAEEWNVQQPEAKATWLQDWAKENPSPPKGDLIALKLIGVLKHELELVTGGSGASSGAGAGQSSASTVAPNARAIVALCVPPLLDLVESQDDASARARVGPLMVSLLTMNDRGVRVMLLTKVTAVAKLLDEVTINTRLFDPLCAGFNDAAPQLRELTLKGMVVFTDKLNEKNMNDKLIRHLARLQADPEDSIRTNTIIFMGKIASKLKPAVREKVLLPSFARGIKDPFPAARLAGLRATAACASHFSVAEVCVKVLPAVMPCLIDPHSAQVRDAAFSCMDAYMSRLKLNSDEMTAKEKVAIAAAHGHQSSVPRQNAPLQYGHLSPSPPPSSDGSGWGSWAMSKLTDQLLHSVGDGRVGTAGPGGTPAVVTASSSQAISRPPPKTQLGFQEAASTEELPNKHEEEWADALENVGDGWDDLDGLGLDGDDSEVDSPPPPARTAPPPAVISAPLPDVPLPVKPTRLTGMKLKTKPKDDDSDLWDDF